LYTGGCGVLRVAFSYMLIVAAVVGFPIALLPTWYFELAPAGIERDALPAGAIGALETALREGWVSGWWGLRQGDFDKDYVTVTADPRFEALYSELEMKITHMCEEFLARPELPEGMEIP
jgi:hypothetical protein